MRRSRFRTVVASWPRLRDLARGVAGAGGAEATRICLQVSGQRLQPGGYIAAKRAGRLDQLNQSLHATSVTLGRALKNGHVNGGDNRCPSTLAFTIEIST
jgi:hypothetical protein